jgi:hypothetical protein
MGKRAYGMKESLEVLRKSYMTSIWYEILPVTVEAGQVMMLRRREDGETQSWLVLHQAGMHPNDTVLEHLELYLGDLFEPRASIVHSTSWRYCHQTERIILTYLVVLPQRTCRRCQAASDRILIQRLDEVEQVHGDNLHPPARIELNNILAHALDHLALLNSYDESIDAVLESGWLEVLETRLPQPAGYLASTTPASENQLTPPVSPPPAYSPSPSPPPAGLSPSQSRPPAPSHQSVLHTLPQHY